MFLFCFFLFSPCPSCISLRVCADREGRFHQHVYPSVSVRLSVHPCVWTCCVGCLLPVPCFLFVGGRGRSRKREQYAGQGRQGQSFGYVHIHGRSMASNKRQHYFRRSNTHTWNRAEVHLLDWIDHKKSLKNSRVWTYRSIWCAGSHFIPRCIPANLKDSPCPSVTVD